MTDSSEEGTVVIEPLPLAHCRPDVHAPPEYFDTMTPPPYLSVLKDMRDEQRVLRSHHIRNSLSKYTNTISRFCLFIASSDVISCFLTSITSVITTVATDALPQPLALFLPIFYLTISVMGRYGVRNHREDLVNVYLMVYACRYIADLMMIAMAIYRGSSWPWNLPIESTLLTLFCVGVRPFYADFYPCRSFWRGAFSECTKDTLDMSPAFKTIVFMLTPHLFALCLLISFATVLNLQHRRRQDHDDLIPSYSQTIEREVY